MTKTKRAIRCGICQRRLRNNRWVYSKFSRNHYCMPGEGCQKK